MTPDELEREHTLTTAAARHEELRVREAVGDRPLDAAEALELLALAEVVARKAAYGRHLTIRSARAAGASWSRIGAALGTTKQAAWEAHGRWIDDQAERHRGSGYEGLDPELEAGERRLAAGD